MPDIRIIKLKIRRGTDAQRRNVVLEQGELGYTTDTKRTFIGDGVTPGGIVTGNVIHSPLINTSGIFGLFDSVRNDIVSIGSSVYQYNGTVFSELSSWNKIATNTIPDEKYITYTFEPNNIQILTLVRNSIDNVMFAPNAAYSQGAIIATANDGLSANIDNSTIIISNNQLKVNVIDNTNISPQSFAKGVMGGGQNKIQLNVNDNFGFTSNTLQLTSLPSNIVKYINLDTTDIVGPGLVTGNNKIEAVFKTADDTTIQNIDGTISLKPIMVPDNNYLQHVFYNEFGQIIGKEYTINHILSCSNENTPLSTFNGVGNQISIGNQLTNQSVVTGQLYDLNASYVYSLTSAGFILLEATQSKNNTAVDRFAIPIFNY